ncbi:MAG: DUF362 domain-containing protein [Deltaproteobacteria bacterium]|nr:DUF362 domain-containing protein [Deltaproteobacteria bacterium]
MRKSIVSIVKGSNPEEMVDRALGHLGGVETLIKKDATVVLKPNSGHMGGPETAVNTSPELVSSVIRVIQKASPGKIILAEASAIGCDTLKCLEASGILEAAEDAGVDEVIDIKREKDLVEIPVKDARSDMKKIALPRFLMEVDHIVNIPIFKSHASMVFSCALKNIKGVVQDKVHYLMHQTNLADAMMDVWSVVRADLTIADLIRPMEGYGPHAGHGVEFGCVVAGKDPVAVDATACRMVGLDLSQVEYFDAAVKRDLGTFRGEHIEIRGDTIKKVFKPLHLPYLDGFDAYPEYHIYTENSCSSCQSLLAFTMAKLELIGPYKENEGCHIFIGRRKKLPDGVEPGKEVILVGDCLRPLRKKLQGQCAFVAGCPPLESWPYRAIEEREDQLEPKPGHRERLEKETALLMEKLYGKEEEKENKG